VQKVRPVVREGSRELRKVIYRTLAPEPEIARRVTNAFRSMLLIGPMNRGKTSWAEAILGETIKHLVEEQGVDESKIAYVYAEAADINKIVETMAGHLDLTRITYLFIFSDDAVASEGQHGRRASSKANVEVSKFYVRIRHILRARHGYTRSLTAIHATQVYHLLDKTFREAADIDVLKALPKSQVDRRQIASLIHPDYVGATFAVLRALGKKRLLAKTLQEFLEAVYTAVVLVDGTPFIVRAYEDRNRIQEEVEERKTWLARVPHVKIAPQTPDDQPGDDNTTLWGMSLPEISEIIKLWERIMQKANVRNNGSNILIEIPGNVKIYVRRRETVERILAPWLNTRGAK